MKRRIVLTVVVLALLIAGVLVPATPALANTETEILRPNAAGEYAQLDQYPDSGYHWQKVDEASHDGDGTYIYTYHEGSTKRDIYHLTNPTFSDSATINKVTVYAYMKCNTESNYYGFIYIKSGAAIKRSSAQGLRSSYTLRSVIFTTDPNTSVAWTKSAVANLQAGVGTYSSHTCGFRATQVYVEVNYTPPDAPTVTTQAVTDIGTITATGNGNITATGGENCSKRGVCWNTTGNPTIADDKSEETDSFGTGVFIRPMTGLTPGQHYYVKAYAYNSSGYGYGSQVEFTTVGPPSMTTNAATNVEETSATLSGEITTTNGANATTRGFEYGLTAAYGTDWHEDEDFGVEAFTHGLTSLTKGELYYCRAYAINTYGTGYGSEVTFLTKPDEPNTFVATAVSGTQIDFTWVKGTGAQKTYVRGKDGSYPADRTDGYEVYFDTGTTASDTGLTGGHIYYYKVWSYATEGGKEQYSDLYDFAYASPGLSLELWFQPITIVTNTGAEGTADSGTTTTLVDDALTQDDDYWNLARLIITETTDHNAPEGETAVITDFTATDDTLHFAALTAAPGSGDTYTVDFGTLSDRAGTAQDGTITWGNNPTGVSVSIGALLPETQAAAEAEAEAVVPEFVPETDAEEMITPGVEGEGFPLYAMFKDLFGTWAELGGPNISMPYFWKLVAVVFGWIFGTGIMLTTRNIFFGIVAYFIGFGVPAGAMGGVLDLWVPIVYGLGALGVGLLTVKWGVSSL